MVYLSLKVVQMNESDRNLVMEFKKRLPTDVSNHIRQLIVFGSRARGNAGREADLDLVVLIDKRNSDIESQLDEAAYSVMWDHDFMPIISLKVFDESRFRSLVERGFSFYQNVVRDGITL